VMLQIVVEAAGTVCDADCSIYSQAVDRQRPPTADRSLADFRQAKKMHIFNTGMSLPVLRAAGSKMFATCSSVCVCVHACLVFSNRLAVDF